MIDLHVHTNYSDGADSLIDVLKKAEEKKLTYISITDHDNCKAYEELKRIKVKDYYTGVIIPGIEIKCAYKARLIEILGYKIDTNMMQEWANEYYKDKSKTSLQKKYFDILCKRSKEMGMVFDEESINNFNPEKEWASVHFYKEIIKHPENKKILTGDILESFDNFSKKYCGDPKNKLYIDKSSDYPTVQEAVDIVKKCNGLVFLPHLFIYKWAKDKEKFINEILENYQIDGIECMHSEFNEKQIEYLLSLTKERKYFRSGGSDYHGKNKPGINLGEGRGNLKIPEEFIKNWL